MHCNSFHVLSLYTFISLCRLVAFSLMTLLLQHGILKLFDFGFSRWLPRKPVSSSKRSNPMYKMTGRVGTRLCMAPEVMRGKTYNKGCDVYSFAIVVWEIYLRSMPFEGTFSTHSDDFFFKPFVSARNAPRSSKWRCPPCKSFSNMGCTTI